MGQRTSRDGEGSVAARRWGGILALAITLAAVGLNFLWFARHGLGPATLVAMSWPLWLGALAAVVAVAGGGWLLGRALAGRDDPHAADASGPPEARD